MKEIFIDLKHYIFSKVFLKQIIIVVVITTAAFLTLVFGLQFYTHHGEAISVPNFSGVMLNQAKKQADELGLKLVVIDSVYLAPGKRGSVVEQNPQPDFKVKEGRKIFITIKAFLPEKTEMPDLHDISLQQAKAELENYGLKIGKINYTSGYENVVIEQYLHNVIATPGKKVNKRQRVDLLLGRGSYPYTKIIDLNGLSLDEAYNRITLVYLNIGKIHYDNTVKTAEDSAKALVWKQEPNILYKNKVNFGSKVNIWLTKDKFKVVKSKIREVDSTAAETL